MSSEASSSPPPPAGQTCAACMHRRRQCEPGCVLAPYFRPEHWERFVAVNRVYGADNVANLLAELPPEQRPHAAATLVFEARAAIKYPVYRCVSYVVVLQQMLKEKQGQLAAAREELAGYVSAAATALQPFGAGSAPSPATQAGAVPMRQGGGPEAKEAGVQFQRGQPQPQANEQMMQQRAEAAREAAAAARSARKQAMKARRDAAAQQQGRQVRHRAVAQHAGTGPAAVLPDQRVHGPSRPDGRVHWQPHHLTAQQIADAQNSAAADEVARVQDLLAVQLQAEEEVARQQHERMRQALDAARERNYPHQAQAMGLIGAAPGQMALQAQQLAAAAEKIAREQQAAAMGLDVTQLGNGQQTVQRFSVPTVKVAREQDMNLMEQAAAFARAMSGATNMAASLPGGSADAGTFLVHQQTQQPQPVNALGFQTGASLPPPLADLPHQQPGDGGADDQFSSDPNRPPDGGGSN